MAALQNLASRAPADRWAWVEIDQGALRANVRAFRAVIPHATKMMCVVKADAYGHGAVPCARVMLAAGADQLAVATVAEGVELREAGIEAPILILSEPPALSIPQILSHDLMPTIDTEEFALAFGECAANMGKVGRYHMAIETGMNRIGVAPADAVDFRAGLDFHRGLECAGTFTHFATADELGGWDWSLQFKRFTDTIAALRAAGFDPGIVHCDNTPGTILHPEAHLDMCRVGVGLYGMHPADTTLDRIELRPVMSVRARVVRVEYPEVGEGVSYGLTSRVPRRNIQIATIPIGYADGLSRTLSNEMDVIVGGVRHRQVGRICMDQCMFSVDVNTNRSFKPVRPIAYGDVATILGADGDERITAEEMARLRGTINYEVTCNFGMRLEKVYV